MSYESFKVQLVRFDTYNPVIAILKSGLIEEVPELELALEALTCVERARVDFERSIDRVRPQIRITLTKSAQSDPDGAWREELVDLLKPIARRKAGVEVEPINNGDRHVANEVALRFTYGEPPTNADAVRLMRQPSIRHARMGTRYSKPTLIIVVRPSADIKQFLEILAVDMEVMLVDY